MRKITPEEHKQILIDMLIYIDAICRQDNIKYSLIGGSLIGAIRHKGIIPWDDDIDIILMPEEYDKLIKILKEKSDKRYSVLDDSPGTGFWSPYVKLIDRRTLLREKYEEPNNNYGVFLDIFRYYYMPKSRFGIYVFYYKVAFIGRMLGLAKRNRTYTNPFKQAIASVARRIGAEFWHSLYTRTLRRAENRKPTSKIMSHWPSYSCAQETQLADDFSTYMDCDFEGHRIMITANYDSVLRTTFGDYMQLPPKEKRTGHNIDNEYWR